MHADKIAIIFWQDREKWPRVRPDIWVRIGRSDFRVTPVALPLPPILLPRHLKTAIYYKPRLPTLSGVHFRHRAYWAMQIITIPAGPSPAAKGEPATAAVSAPVVALTVKAETVSETWFAT